MKPDISVVIPLYNKERYIQRMIDSVLRQTFQNFECIIIDSSDDRSMDIVRECSDPRIVSIHSHKITAAQARNLGAQIAQSDLIAFLDADDEWQPDHLATLHRLRQKFSSAGVYSTPYVKLKPDCLPMVMVFYGIPCPPWEGHIPSYLTSCSRGDEPVHSSSCAVPRDVFITMGGFPEELMYGEDQFLWGKISLKYPVAYSWEGLAIYHTEAQGRICDEIHEVREHPFSAYLRQELAAGRISSEKTRECRAYIRRKRYAEIFSRLVSGEASTPYKDTLVTCEDSVKGKGRIASRSGKIIRRSFHHFYHSSINDFLRRCLCRIYGCYDPGLTLIIGKKSLPRISIITPSYQQGEFIEATLHSVISQDYPSLEYIVIDGGSSDNSVNIIRRHESKITRWLSEPDQGQTDALNKGFKLATGDIIGWINSDDVLLPDALAKVGDFFKCHPDVSLVYGDALAIDRHGNPLFLKNPGKFDIRWLIRTDDIPQSSVFFRRDFIISIGLLDNRLHYAMDYDLLVKAALRTNPCYLAGSLSAFRIYPETKTSSGKTQFSVDVVYFIDKVLRNHHLPDDQKISLLTTQFWRIFEIILMRDIKNITLTDLKNDPCVIQVTQKYVDLLYPHFLNIQRIPISINKSRLHSILSKAVSDLLNQYPNRLGFSDADITKFVQEQDFDIFIFSYRFCKAHQRIVAFRLFVNICLSIPSLINNPQFWRILKR